MLIVLRSTFRLPGIARYTERASGLMIALTGVVVLLIEARMH